jgi:CRISPR-associated protein Cmr4
MNQLLFIHAHSPLHAGIGQGVGAIDLPIAREKATGVPFLPGSSIKGTLRDACEILYANNPNLIKAVFGEADTPGNSNIGAVQFSDAKLLFMPVRSLAGVFAWVTSPFLLARFVRDAKMGGVTGLESITNLKPPPGEAWYASATDLKMTIDGADKVYLEDLQLNLVSKPELDSLAQQLASWIAWDIDFIKKHLCIIPDDEMSYLLETATEVVARVRLNDDLKVVEEGALWYEESLPAESILYGIVQTENTRREFDLKDVGKMKHDAGVVATIVRNTAHDKTLQFGGKATVGRGLCSVRFSGGNHAARA